MSMYKLLSSHETWSQMRPGLIFFTEMKINIEQLAVVGYTSCEEKLLFNSVL